MKSLTRRTALAALTASIILGAPAAHATPAMIAIQVAWLGASIAPTMSGIFFEDLNF